jgi:uncharacterized protein
MRKIRVLYLRQIPRRKRMHGGFLHRLFGERLFDPRLWKPTRDTFAGGLAMGLIIGLLPTFYLQIFLSFIFSYILRLNVSAAVLGTLVTNPFTTPPILVLQYKLGVLLVGSPSPEELARYEGILRILGHARPFMVGSVVSALVAGLLGYFLALLFWDGTVKLEEKVRHRHHPHQGSKDAGSQEGTPA